ncbi:MAG: hypothetical protein O0W85_07690, partial [Methanocorpusculum sp.]|nr:hypothetical protein [Methanocorpusculum sp.]MDE2548538.1 hypothetical protein [Methanocorpusculum sp.]
TGGVAVANAAKNAREAFFRVNVLFLCLPLITTKYTRDTGSGYGTSGSFASICRRACDNDPRSGEWSKTFGLAIATPPAQLWAGWRATKSKCDERSWRSEATHLRYLRYLFIMPSHHSPTNSFQKKLQSTFVTSHRKRG